ncbi:MAG: PAS domain S-box protein [Bacteroidetes bacterium]|nr:PAS domain S-box protein [Bacteroidota bacterium]
MQPTKIPGTQDPFLSEFNMNQLFEQSFIGMSVLSLDGKWIKVNSHLCKMFGYSKEELLEKKFNDITHSDDKDIGTLQAKLLITGEIEHFEIEKRYIHKDGRIVYTLLNSALIKDEKGTPKYFISQTKDVSELKSSIEALRISEEKFRSIFEKAPIGIAHFNSEGNITAFNKVLMDILGTSKEKISNVKTTADVKDENQLTALKEALEGRIGTHEGEYKSILSGKSTYLKTIYAPLFGPDGKVIGGTSISEDITSRKLYEQRIKTSLKEKELLLREVYHRAKNNLQTTISLINIQINESTNKELISALQETKNRLYAMSKVHEVLCKSDNLDYILLKAYINDLVGNFDYSNLRYDTEIERSLTLNIDQTNTVGLILNELITNSLKHNPDKTIAICIKIKKTETNAINFYYSDNGQGINNETSFLTNTALGMNLVKVLVEEQLEGTLKCTNDNGFNMHIEFKANL